MITIIIMYQGDEPLIGTDNTLRYTFRAIYSGKYSWPHLMISVPTLGL